MLICPSCHSANPDLHKFCQRCGTSLLEKTCPKCNHKGVPYEAASCPNCGQFTGQIWKVRIETLATNPQIRTSSSSTTKLQTAVVTPPSVETAPVEATILPLETTDSPAKVHSETATIAPPEATDLSAEVHSETALVDATIAPPEATDFSAEANAQTSPVDGIVPPLETTDLPGEVNLETAPVEATTLLPETTDLPAEVNIETVPLDVTIPSPETTDIPGEVNLETATEATTSSPETTDLPAPAEVNAQMPSVDATIPVPQTIDLPETQTDSNLLEEALPETPAAAETSDRSLASLPSDTLDASYLDVQQRYKLFNTDPLNLKVLDLKPLEATVLSALPILDRNQGGKQNFAPPQLDIPKIALDYLKLREKCASAVIPILHDAWQDNNRVFLLLEDRSQWASLAEFWSIPQVQTAKVLSWMLQMAELWTVLEVEGYCQSLLRLENLKLDEDEAIALEQLYPDENGVKIELGALGKVWLELFSASAKTQFLSLSQMLKSMCDGQIKDVEQLKSELRGIRDELQPISVDSEALNSLDGDDLEIVEEEMDESPTIVLPKRLTSIEDAGATHPGKQRPYNEDFFAIETQTSKAEYPNDKNLTAKGLYILCDGMGGHASGDVASKTAVKTIKDFFDTHWQNSLPDENTIKEAVFLANQELYNLNQKSASSGTGRMGTTLVMLLVHNTRAAIAHVGDSRLYSVTKQDGLKRLTVDHEVGQREIQRGVDEAIAYGRPDAYQLTQALGPRDRNFIKPDVKFMDIDRDILLVLGSDGLTDNDLLEKYGATHLLPLLSSSNDLDRGANKLIELANEYNGHDNITAVLVRVRAAS